jgi:hypothetical protein
MSAHLGLPTAAGGLDDVQVSSLAPLNSKDCRSSDGKNHVLRRCYVQSGTKVQGWVSGATNAVNGNILTAAVVCAKSANDDVISKFGASLSK